MYTTPPKKMLIINILDILKNNSDENHRLSQKKICELLEADYNMTVDRKSVKRNLMNLLDYGYPLNYSEKIRVTSNGEEQVLFTDWYLEHDFEDSELRLLIDSLLFSKHIPYNQCKQLINKIKRLSNKHFSKRVRHICNLPEDMPQNKQLFYIIDILDEAISSEKQVKFKYNEYGTDKKLHPRTDANGNIREYIINPYQMIATNGRYYLLCNNDAFDNVSYYRIDRISDIEILNTTAKNQRYVEGLENGLQLPTQMAEHIYMFSGENSSVTFSAQKFIISEIIDWFGTNVYFFDETDNTVKCRVKVNLSAMKFWSLQHASYVKILTPETLVKDVKQELTTALSQY